MAHRNQKSGAAAHQMAEEGGEPVDLKFEIENLLTRPEIMERLQEAGIRCYDYEPTEDLVVALAEHMTKEGETL